MKKPPNNIDIDWTQALVSGVVGAIAAVLIFKLGGKRLKDPLKWILLVIVFGLAGWYFIPLFSELLS